MSHAYLDDYPPVDDDGEPTTHAGPIIEVKDPDEYMERNYQLQGQYYSPDAATWCADIQTWEGESGHTFYLKDFMPCEDNCPCERECEF